MDELIKLVAQMRQLQKDYFKTRDRGILAKCKEIEQKVDKAINELETEK